jgi:V8-like Glu-specific endopeptidase
LKQDCEEKEKDRAHERAYRDEDRKVEQQRLDSEREQASAGRWTGPLAVAVAAGVAGLIGTFVSTYLNRQLERERSGGRQEIERRKQEGTLILEAVKSPDEVQRAKNLVSLHRSGAIQLTPQQLTDLEPLAGPTPVPGVPAAGQSDPDPAVTLDDRTRVRDTKAPPYRAICWLAVTFPDGTRFGASGCLVGPRAVLTTAHALYLHEHGGAARSVQVAFGRDEEVKPFGEVEVRGADAVRVPEEWIAGVNGVAPLRPEVAPAADLTRASGVGCPSLGTRRTSRPGPCGRPPPPSSG